MFGRDDVPDGTEEHADFLHGAWLHWVRGPLAHPQGQYERMQERLAHLELSPLPALGLGRPQIAPKRENSGSFKRDAMGMVYNF